VALAEGNGVSSSDLIDHAKDFDQTTVVFEGEVIGDILYRGQYAWLAVDDGSNTIGCYVTRAQAETISFVGGYGKRGDTVSVQGVFHRACAEHGGDLDIHASSVTILSVGARVPMPLSRLVTTLAIALPIPAAVLLFLVWKRRAASRLPGQNSVTNSAQK
jgi:hypothetical protein